MWQQVTLCSSIWESGDIYRQSSSSKGLGFFESEAPPLSLLSGWDVMSEVNPVPKQWG